MSAPVTDWPFASPDQEDEKEPKRFYGVADERGLAFFTVHEKADVCHAQTGAEMIARHCATEHDRELTIEAGDRALAGLLSLLDAC